MFNLQGFERPNKTEEISKEISKEIPNNTEEIKKIPNYNDPESFEFETKNDKLEN